VRAAASTTSLVRFPFVPTVTHRSGNKGQLRATGLCNSAAGHDLRLTLSLVDKPAKKNDLLLPPLRSDGYLLCARVAEGWRTGGEPGSFSYAAVASTW
jgi:hypothetical protein